MKYGSQFQRGEKRSINNKRSRFEEFTSSIFLLRILQTELKSEQRMFKSC